MGKQRISRPQREKRRNANYYHTIQRPYDSEAGATVGEACSTVSAFMNIEEEQSRDIRLSLAEKLAGITGIEIRGYGDTVPPAVWLSTYVEANGVHALRDRSRETVEDDLRGRLAGAMGGVTLGVDRIRRVGDRTHGPLVISAGFDPESTRTIQGFRGEIQAYLSEISDWEPVNFRDRAAITSLVDIQLPRETDDIEKVVDIVREVVPSQISLEAPTIRTKGLTH